MRTPLLLAAALPFLTLAACDSKPSAPEVIDTNPDPMANVLANRAPVELPPSISADKTFRCKDNSVAYVTFFHGDKQVFVRTAKDGSPTTLKADKAGDPYVADGGWKLTGSPDNITLTRPGKGSLTCKS